MSTEFDRDTAVRRRPPGSTDHFATDGTRPDQAVATAAAITALFDADVSPNWRAGRGPHGGYLAAMLLRALTETVADAGRAPRSLTIHYARAPEPGPVEIRTAIERAGRSLSTLSARMEQDGKLMALALAAFSVPWHAPEISDLPLPDVEPAEPRTEPPRPPHPQAPPFARHMEFQPRMGTPPFTGTDAPMEIGGWLALPEPRPLDALALAFFSDALFSPPLSASPSRLSRRRSTSRSTSASACPAGSTPIRTTASPNSASRAFARPSCTKASSRRTA